MRVVAFFRSLLRSGVLWWLLPARDVARIGHVGPRSAGEDAVHAVDGRDADSASTSHVNETIDGCRAQ